MGKRSSISEKLWVIEISCKLLVSINYSGGENIVFCFVNNGDVRYEFELTVAKNIGKISFIGRTEFVILLLLLFLVRTDESKSRNLGKSNNYFFILNDDEFIRTMNILMSNCIVSSDTVVISFNS